jgi:hypothetical protein
LDAGGPVTIKDVAPIVAMQLNIVGPALSKKKAVFKSGAGIITYAAKNPLTALSAVPSCAEVSSPTNEVSNSRYNAMAAESGTTLTQTFWIPI